MDNRVIQEKDAGIYQYGLSILIYSAINLATILLIGMAMECIPECICFMTCYIILRKFTGGYHARTPFACYLISTSIFFTSIYVVKSGFVSSYMLITVAVLAFICSFLVPVDTENKVLSTKEKTVYRGVSLIVFLFEVLLGVAACIYHFRMLYDSIILAVFCCELLVIVGHINNRLCGRRVSGSEVPETCE